MKIELELDEYIEKLTKVYKDGFNDGYNMRSISTATTDTWTYPTVTWGLGVKGVYSDKVTCGTGNVTCVNPGEVK